MPSKKKSPVTRRLFVVEEVKTTLCGADVLWQQLDNVAKINHMTVAELVSLVEDNLGTDDRLSSALRASVFASRVTH